MVVETHMKLCMTEPDLSEKCLLQKLGKWTKNGPKIWFFEFIEKFCHQFLLSYFIKKTYIICCVPAQTSCLGKCLFLRYGPKYSQPIRLQDFLINDISRTNQLNSLIICTLIQIHMNSQKCFGWVWSNMGVARLVMGL